MIQMDSQQRRSAARQIAGPDLRPWFIAAHELPPIIRWSEFWGNEQPVEIDVGCGRGLFVYNASLNNPSTNYFGLELDFQEGRRGATRLWKRRAANARVIGGDALVVLRRQIERHSVHAIHVYFPDPWWKHRHRRRRIFTDEFVGICADVLKHGGLLHAWTDVAEYYEVISRLMNHHPEFESLPPPVERAATHDLDFHTSFERKKRKLGCTIYRGLWRRRSPAECSNL